MYITLNRDPSGDSVDSRGVHTMVAQGMYAYAMERWLKAGFKPEQFLLVTTDELASDPKTMMRKVPFYVQVKILQ